MTAMPIKVIGGDFIGSGSIQFGTLWFGPKAKKFQGITLKKPKTKYAPSDVAKLTELQQEQAKSFVGASVAAGAGALLLGGVGLVAGALAGGNKHKTIVAVEFSDGKKVAFSTKPDDKVYLCLRLYAMENGLIQHSF